MSLVFGSWNEGLDLIQRERDDLVSIATETEIQKGSFGYIISHFFSLLLLDSGTWDGSVRSVLNVKPQTVRTDCCTATGKVGNGSGALYPHDPRISCTTFVR